MVQTVRVSTNISGKIMLKYLVLTGLGEADICDSRLDAGHEQLLQ